MKENSPVKFYSDLEFEPNKYEENSKKEVNEMSRIFKKYVSDQWLKDSGNYRVIKLLIFSGNQIDPKSWLEFDASKIRDQIAAVDSGNVQVTLPLII
jgi:hypothetical protein